MGRGTLDLIYATDTQTHMSNEYNTVYSIFRIMGFARQMGLEPEPKALLLSFP